MSEKKRKAGSNKTRKKQRQYQIHVRAQLAAGLVNGPEGNWISISAIRDGKVANRASIVAQRMGAGR